LGEYQGQAESTTLDKDNLNKQDCKLFLNQGLSIGQLASLLQR